MRREFIEMSTGHLPIPERETLTWLIRSQQWTCAYEGPAGWFIWVGEFASDHCPPVLRSILLNLTTEEVDYVLFDADAEPSPNLEMFE